MNLRLEATIRPMRNPTLLEAPIDGELVLLSLEKSRYYGSGSVGRRIWDLIDGRRDLSAILKVLLDEYEVDRETCECEVGRFVTALVEQGLVIVGDADRVS